MNIRFYNARILTMDGDFDIINGQLWTEGNRIIYIGDGTDTDRIYKERPQNIIKWDREIDVKNNLLMPASR